jgi:tetratricopeptide (TPR) repeat protein
MSFRPRILALFLVLVGSLTVSLAAMRGQAPSRPAESSAAIEAIRLNNLGVATMNQQKFDPALAYFEQAAKADPGFLTARINQAIALASLQKYDAARELLVEATGADPKNARAWYNLGLLQKSTGEAEASLASFQKAAALAPRDAHTAYFVGLMAGQIQQYDTSIASFQRALEIDPYLVSAEFGLARSFQRAGRAEEARSHLDRFQRLTTEKVAAAMSLTYGDQGPLSLAQAVLPKGDAAEAGVPVKFVDAAAQPFEYSENASATPDGLGAGACVFDANGDGSLDVLVLSSRGDAPLRPGAALFLRGTGGTFTRAEGAGFTVQGPAIGCAAADYDNDERPDVVITTRLGVLLFHNEGDATFTSAGEKAGLPPPVARVGGALPPVPLGPSFIDYDHDGDADLMVPRAATAGQSGAIQGDGTGHTLVFRNNGNGTFVEVSAERGLAGNGANVAVVGTDFNNDRAVDLVVTGGPSPAVLLNPREGAFTRNAFPADAAAKATVGVVVLDFDKDGWMDVAFTHAGAPAVSLWRNAGGSGLEAVALPRIEAARGWGIAAVDYDNDGWIDLAAVITEAPGPTGAVTESLGTAGTVRVLRNNRGQFVDTSDAVGTRALVIGMPRSLAAADLDDDGDADLLVTRAGGSPVLLQNDGGHRNHALRIALKGLADNRSGVGTKVEVQAGPRWQKFETVSASGYLGQSSPDILGGIGTATTVDVVRMLWATGVVQDEVQIDASKPAVIEQVDRRGSSCPILFTWNGREYEFITDAIGAGVIGHWVAPGETNVPDPDEYIKVEGRQVAVRDGRISMKFIEPMEEVNFLDEVRLVAIDHPEGTDVHPHEYFAATAPPPSDRVFATRGARPPVAARDDKGRDVLALLRDRDGRYVDDLGRSPFRGFAALHALELDLGPRPANAPLRLILSGLTDYFTATSVFAASQAGVTAVVPYVEVQAPDGSWQRVVDDMGFPAGLRRTMTADLTGKVPDEARRIRIWTNLKIYWDQVLVDTTPDGAVPVRRTAIPLASASLSFLGFPRERVGAIYADLTYSYGEVSRSGPWARHRGHYTRYGDVTPLLTSTEDRFAIFGAGDEVSLEFDATALPPLPRGWTRDYLFYARGYVKDMDFYGAYAQTVTPLPFSTMGTYPYLAPARYPEALAGYLLEWNTREVGNESWPTYRAEYR